MSATTVITDVVAILGVLGVGSILGQYIGSSKDRREARAQVLGALSDAERGRWIGTDGPIARSEFETSVRKLQTAALIARLPRDAAWEYAVLSQAARWASEEAWEQDPDPETGGGIDKYLADANREAATAISALAWSWGPTQTWRWRRAKKRIDEQLAHLQSQATKAMVDRSRRFGFM